MKKLIRVSLLLGLLVSLLCVSALADGGFYGIEIQDAKVDIVPQKADGTAATKTTQTIGGESVTDYYPDSVRLKVTYAGTESSEQYLIMGLTDDKIPSESNIAYINQKAGNNGTLDFDVYTSDLKEGTIYIYLSSSGSDGGRKLVATVKYYSSVMIGDVSGDNKLDNKDVAMIARHLAEWAGYENLPKEAADVNKDDEVNNKDVAILARHLAEWSDYLDLSAWIGR